LLKGLRKKVPLGRNRHRWEYNSNIGLQALRWGGLDWIDLVQDRESWQGFGCGNGTSGFKNAGNFWDS